MECYLCTNSAKEESPVKVYKDALKMYWNLVQTACHVSEFATFSRWVDRFVHVFILGMRFFNLSIGFKGTETKS